MFALPPPNTYASTSLWERRKNLKSCSASSDAEVEQNVLSLLLLDSSIDDVEPSSSPVSLHSTYSPWSTGAGHAAHSATFRSCSPLFAAAPIQRSRSLDQQHFGTMEMHTAQLAVKSALEVLDDSPCSLRIATTSSLGLSAPASPALSSPTSPAESCFSDSAEVGEVKKKGRARMSQEKRKRLARRREREALIASLTEQQQSRSAPVTPSTGYFHPSWEYSSPRREDFPPSPALTHGRAGSATPDSSPVNPKGEMGSSPPRLVVQPPSPQRVRTKWTSSTWSAASGAAGYAVY